MGLVSCYTISMKQCLRCGQNKSSLEFYVSKKSWCKNCIRLYTNKWAREHPEIIRSRAKLKRLKLRLKILEHYGGDIPKCSCCGESNIVFLCIDHVKNDGHIERKKFGSDWMKQVVRNNFPKGYQILCFNCNNGKRISGICPHQKQTILNN